GDLRAVLGLDHALKVGQVDVVGPKPGMVQPAKAAGENALAWALSQKDAAAVGALDVVVLRIRELDAVERLEPHLAVSRSTYFASTSTSRVTSSPGSSDPRVVVSSVCRTSATSNASSLRPLMVSETPSTVIDPFST